MLVSGVTCPPPDRNAMPKQDLDAFQRVVKRSPYQRKRLQELGELIPASDGIGAELDASLDECHRLRGDLALARRKAKKLWETYGERLAFLREELELLRSLGLTENLYRKHEDDGSPEVPGDV